MHIFSFLCSMGFLLYSMKIIPYSHTLVTIVTYTKTQYILSTILATSKIDVFSVSDTDCQVIIV